MNWLTLKAKLWAAGAFLLAFVAAILKLRYVENKLDKVTEQKKKAEANVKHQREVMQADKAADEQADIRQVEAINEIKETGGSSTFLDPNDLLRDDET